MNSALSTSNIEISTLIFTGVLHGGVLSPLLFNYYINDLIIILAENFKPRNLSKLDFLGDNFFNVL